MKIHCMVAALVVIAGLILGISVTEWCICLGLFGMVMALELVNTAVEAVVDLVTEERHPLAKIAKDTAAGAVLIAAIMAAIVGLIILFPRDLFFWEYDRNRKLCFRIGSGVGLWCDGPATAGFRKGENIMELGEGLKKILLVGIGTAAVTAEKSKEILDELVKRVSLRLNRVRFLIRS